MTDLGRLTLRLDADVQNLRRRLDEAERLARQTGRQTGQGFRASILNGIGIDLGGKINSLIFGQFAKGERFIKSSLATYQQYSQAIQQFGVFSGASQTEIQALTDETKRLGAETSKSSTDVARVAVELTKLGFSASQAKESLNGVVALAEATDERVGLSGQTLGVVLSNFSEFSKETEDVNRVADILTTAANSSALNLSKIRQGIATVGGTASSFNQDFESTVKVLGVFADAGIQAEASGTALKNIILGLANPSKKAQEAITQLGIQARDSNGELRNVFEMIPELQEAFLQFDAKQQGQFAQDIFGREAIGPFLKLLGTTKQRLGEIEQAYASLGGTAQANKKKLQQGLAGAAEALGGSIEVFKLDLASAFAPGVESATRFFQSIIDNITANKTLFNDLKNATEVFTKLLKENADLSESIADAFESLISEGLKTSTELALDLFDYFSQNPDVLSEMVDVLDTFVRLLGDGVKLALELGQILGPLLEGTGFVLNKTAEGYKNIRDRFEVGVRPGAAGRQVAQELGLSVEEFDRRMLEKTKSSDDKPFNPFTAYARAYNRTQRGEQAVDETLDELIQERNQKQRADALTKLLAEVPTYKFPKKHSYFRWG